MGRIKWLLLAAVCGVHFALIGSFLHGGRSGQPAKNSESRLILQIVNTEPPEREESTRPTAPPSLPPPAITTETATSPPPPPANVDRKSDVSPKTAERSNSEPFPFFNRNRFLDAGELDESATASKAFDDALDKALPARFDSIVLEFLIDENGQTVQLACIEGDCSAALLEKLQQLLAIPFAPATKNGQPVASRKLIEILPTPTFGF